NGADELGALPASVPAGGSGRTRGPAGRGPGGSGQKSPWPMILLIGGGSVLLLALLVCGGLGFAAWQISRGVSNFANAMRPPETLDEALAGVKAGHPLPEEVGLVYFQPAGVGEDPRGGGGGAPARPLHHRPHQTPPDASG